MCKTDKEEVRDVLRMLDECGVDYYVPTKMVPYYVDGVKCGLPEELAAYTYDMVLQQTQETGEGAQLSVRADGDSMRDAGIESGDRLWVMLTQQYTDGDIIAVLVDGKCTAKTFFRNTDGRCWLVPENDAYQPIPLSEDQEIRILGKVIAVTHRVKSSSYMECSRKVYAVTNPKKEEEREEVVVPLTDKQMECAVKAILPQLKNARHWYSVFRVLVDRRYYDETDFEAFADKVNAMCPDFKYKANAKDLGRIAYGSFAKPVSQWNVKNAPVTGKRYLEYYVIATNFDALLREGK